MTATLRISLYVWLTAISLLLPQCAAAEGNRVQENERDSIQLFRGVAVSYDLAGTVMRMVLFPFRERSFRQRHVVFRCP